MQWDKVKTILLAILLIVDGFLFWNLSSNYVISYQRDRETLASVRALVGDVGVTLGEDFTIPAGQTLPALEAERSIRAEEETAALLLGEDLTREDGEDGSLRFLNDAGESILFQRDGRIEARLKIESAPGTGSAREALASSLLAGFPTHGGVFTSEGEAVKLTAPVAGVPLFDRELTIRFQNTWAFVSGRWTLELPYTTTGSEQYYDGADALLTYAYSAPENTVIREMELGYRLGEETAGRVPFVVYWRIVTDDGVDFLDTSKMTIRTEEIS